MNPARDFLSRPQPTGKSGTTGDRSAIRRLWSLLYRAVRRHSIILDDLQRRVENIEEEQRRGRGEVPD